MSRTFDLADKLIYYTLVYLDKNGATRISKLCDNMKKDLKFDDWERAVYPKTGNVRWDRMLLSFSLDLDKAGWIAKRRKVWDITPKGKQALGELREPSKLRQEAARMYKIWNAIPREELLRRKAAEKAAKANADNAGLAKSKP
ncbi:MAG: winged helix-turn-helix domain-containing protein [Rickettsiales bacterium]|jgi:restriction system protein|nr:winged helix-turn-helix domain-containing protein [Rickettsiales bacterium]